jgi:hypothetical protein
MEPAPTRGAVKLEDKPMFKTRFLIASAFVAWAFGASLVATQPAAAAEAKSGQLAGEELRRAISGKTLYLKISGFELPISYSARGTMVGTMGTVAAALARGDGASDRGKWWIADNQLCQRWTSWLDGKSYCYSFTVSGKSVQWVRDDGATGTARIGG